ncbi:hypothetical protein [uncultured Acetobacteroides sp.]|uniref:hypothetical protein n=1 Tax=uncultured Acetobacteroides sp. TaxID=1760811 RepID=UPI0029F4828A|nr:hypothetical protein [uncultured Acetobacteroides sp.]
MRTYFFLALLLLSFSSNAQNLGKDQIVGSWIVAEAKISIKPDNPEMQKQIDAVKQGFTNAVFEFSASGNFTLIFPPNTAAFFKELYIPKNSKWIISEKNHTIKIGSKSDGYSLMQIEYGIVNNDVYFLIDESGILLKMTR